MQEWEDSVKRMVQELSDYSSYHETRYKENRDLKSLKKSSQSRKLIQDLKICLDQGDEARANLLIQLFLAKEKV